jgi:hypothetical protein
MSGPIPYMWTGEAWRPERRFMLACQKAFGEGEIKWLEEVFERSPESHKHYFACINEAWKNLPDDLALQFATPDRLRKHALINTGFFTMLSYPCDTAGEAVRWGQNLAREFPDDEVSMRNDGKSYIVERRMAASQSYKSMSKRKFQESKDKVLGFVSKMIGVSSDELGRNAGRAA